VSVIFLERSNKISNLVHDLRTFNFIYKVTKVNDVGILWGEQIPELTLFHKLIIQDYAVTKRRFAASNTFGRFLEALPELRLSLRAPFDLAAM
jgi:hypothetical protein